MESKISMDMESQLTFLTNVIGIDDFGRSVLDLIAGSGVDLGNTRLVDVRDDVIQYENSAVDRVNISLFNDKEMSSEALLKRLIDVLRHEKFGKSELAMVVYRLDEENIGSHAKFRLVQGVTEEQDVFAISIVVVPFLNDGNREKILGRIREIQSFSDGLLIMFSDNIIGMHGNDRQDMVEQVVSKVILSFIGSLGSLINFHPKDYRTIFPKGELRYVGLATGYGVKSKEIAINKAVMGVTYDSSILHESYEGVKEFLLMLEGDVSLIDVDELIEGFIGKYPLGTPCFTVSYRDDIGLNYWKILLVVPPIRQQ